MKVKEIYENALALSISRTDDEDDLEFYAIKIMNIVLAEVFANNNQLRQKKGKEPLAEPARVNSTADETECEIELYAPLCYALAAKLLQAQEETGLAAVYNNQYISLLNMVTPAVRVEVE